MKHKTLYRDWLKTQRMRIENINKNEKFWLQLFWEYEHGNLSFNMVHFWLLIQLLSPYRYSLTHLEPF